MKKSLLAIALLISLHLVPMPSFADQCIDWPRVMAKYTADNLPRNSVTIKIGTFENFTGLASDDWLAYGIPYLLADFLTASKGITPLVGPVASFYAEGFKPQYSIEGMFQHVAGKLRIFVKLINKGELQKQFQLDVNYPQNNEFFVSVGKAALGIMEILSPAYDRERFAQIENATISVPAYENYVRGILSYYTYDPNQFDISKTWFEESKKADLYYKRAYEGLADLFAWMALYNKQEKKPYASYLAKAQKEITDVQTKFANRPELPKPPKKYVVKYDGLELELTNRFLLANAEFVAGLSAAGKSQWLGAAEYFQKALQHTPEDAITWQHLYKMRLRTGDKGKASEALKKAMEINKCIVNE